MTDRSNQIIANQNDRDINIQETTPFPQFQYFISYWLYSESTTFLPTLFLNCFCLDCLDFLPVFFTCESWTFYCIYSQIWAIGTLGADQVSRKNMTSDFPLLECYYFSGPKNLKLLNLGRHKPGISVVQRFSLLLEIKLANKSNWPLLLATFFGIWFS